jgi:hypothetical protein
VNRFGSRDRAGIDSLVESTLSHARMAREPSAADQERVLTALRDYLDDPTGALQGDSALQDDVGLHEGDVLSGVREIAQGAVRSAVSPLARWARPWSALPASVQKLVWVSAVTGGLGFWLGSQPDSASDSAPGLASKGLASKAVASDVGPSPTRASEATSHPSVMPIPPIAPVPSLPGEAPIASLEPAATRAAAPANAAPRAALPVIAALPPAAALPEPRRTLVPLSPPVERSAPASAPPGRLPEAAALPTAVSTPAVSTPAVSVAPAPLPPAALPPPLGSDNPSSPPLGAASPPASDPRFLEAVRLVQRAQRAVESGAASTALSLLDELDARFPAALLNEERLATRVLALCASGAVARAKRVAAELGARNSSSIYAARIAQSCAGSAASRPAATPAPRR